LLFLGSQFICFSTMIETSEGMLANCGHGAEWCPSPPQAGHLQKGVLPSCPTLSFLFILEATYSDKNSSPLSSSIGVTNLNTEANPWRALWHFGPSVQRVIPERWLFLENAGDVNIGSLKFLFVDVVLPPLLCIVVGRTSKREGVCTGVDEMGRRNSSGTSPPAGPIQHAKTANLEVHVCALTLEEFPCTSPCWGGSEA
jgi:hypothetical protein